MFGASSRQTQRQNTDGSWNVHCYGCGQFIAKTMERIQRAQCELCRRSETGEEITDDLVIRYKLAKADRIDVAYINLPEPDMRAIGIKKKFSFASIAGEVMNALGNFKLAGKDKQPDVQSLPSVVVAKQKRKPRLFGSISLGAANDPNDADKK